MNEVELVQYIRKAQKAGISNEQISNDLLIKGVGQNDIDMAFATVNTNSAPPGKAASPLSILISIGFILYGIYKVANYDGVRQTFGYVFIVLGIIGLIAKLMSRKV
jgi:hypothetical protein